MLNIDQLKNNLKKTERLIEKYLSRTWLTGSSERLFVDEFCITGGECNVDIIYDINTEYLFVDDKILSDLQTIFGFEKAQAKDFCLKIIRGCNPS